MPYLIATDEAGLGPNLGPMVVSATAWELPGTIRPSDLFDTLGESVVASVAQADDRRFVVADSKQLYKPGGTKAHLERGVLVAIASLQKRIATWRELFDTLSPESQGDRAEIPWYAEYDEPLPLDLDADNLTDTCEQFVETCRSTGVRLCDVRSRVVYPMRFNCLLDRYGKGELLSHVTLELAAEQAAAMEGAISIVCDKHGGRNRYADLLARNFPDAFIEIHGEGREQSVYAFGPVDRRVDVVFRTRAESILAVGLASMVSKYLRELSMRAFNRYWCGQLEGLRPTAGYPQDAKRFRREIAAVQRKLEIEDDMLWRRK